MRGRQVMLGKKDRCVLVRGFFPSDIIAGFTDTRTSGKLPSDLEQVLSALGKERGVCYMKQPHSSTVDVAEKSGLYEGDGLLSNKPGLALVVKTADCLPLILASIGKKTLGVVHMGWRSAEAGILENLGDDMSSFQIILGPGLRKCCYEVGKEFCQYPRVGPYVEGRRGSLYFDPITFVKRSLMDRGAREENIFDLGICTLCSGGEVFSYRKTGTSSRTLSFVLRA